MGATAHLGRAIDELRNADLESSSIEIIAHELVELRRQIDWLEGEWSRRVAFFDHHDGRALEGHSSTTAFLKHRCRMSAGRSARALSLGQRIQVVPQIEKAFEVGELSLDQVRTVTDLPEHLDQELIRDESTLGAALAELSVADSRRIVTYWRNGVDCAGSELSATEQWDRRYLFASRTLGGMVKIDGLLDAEAGEAFLAGLGAITPVPGMGDTRSAAQRRADGLIDLVRAFLDSGQAPGREKPHVLVLADVESLCGHGGGTHESSSGIVMTPQQIRQIACDCAISRVVFGPDSQPVDIGRASRVVPPAMARAVIARDRHCTYRGCDRPARWCDIHHIEHWADGGITALCNLRLLCRYHHTLLHRQEAAAFGPPPPIDNPNMLVAGASHSGYG